MTYIVMHKGREWYVGRRQAGYEDQYGFVCRSDHELAAREICRALNEYATRQAAMVPLPAPKKKNEARRGR